MKRQIIRVLKGEKIFIRETLIAATPWTCKMSVSYSGRVTSKTGNSKMI